MKFPVPTRRRLLLLLVDLVFLIAAFWGAYLLRFEFQIPNRNFQQALVQLPMITALQLAALLMTRVHMVAWRYVGIRELVPCVRVALYAAVPLLILRAGLPSAYQALKVPLSVIVIDAILVICGVLGVRLARRLLYERSRRASASGIQDKRAILIGAGNAGVLAAREIGHGDTDFDVVGFVDDDPLKHGLVIHGIPVLGSTRELPRLADELDVDQAVITIANADSKTIQRILDICTRARIKARSIPGFYELLQGNVSINRIIDVEIEGLLGRDPIRLDSRRLELFVKGKRIMVTGAGGTIGSELGRQVARLGPEKLLLVERAEFTLFVVSEEIQGLWPQIDVIPLVADVGDRIRMSSILATYRPHVLLHAAAHKHVPMMEINPCEAIRNNVLATSTLGELAGEAGTEKFVLISTDKAGQPTSVMGASKRVAELVVQDLNLRHSAQYVAVRFGNVIGSTGSVLPIFQAQIRKGGPVTVTHPEMTRFFMTVREASQLVLEAGAMGAGGELFVLDMGKPIRILKLAEEMIRLSGFKLYEEIEIVFGGPRLGEKIHEELSLKEENLCNTRHPKIFVDGSISPKAETFGQPSNSSPGLRRELRSQTSRQASTSSFRGHSSESNRAPRRPRPRPELLTAPVAPPQTNPSRPSRPCRDKADGTCNGRVEQAELDHYPLCLAERQDIGVVIRLQLRCDPVDIEGLSVQMEGSSGVVGNHVRHIEPRQPAGRHL